MSCGCGVGSEDYDGSAEFHHVEIRKARKEHKCEECKRTIQRGEQYQWMSGKFDGDMYWSKTCLGCADVIEAYQCGSVSIGWFWHEMRDYVFPDFRMAGECWDKLSARGKAWLVQKWREWKGLEVKAV